MGGRMFDRSLALEGRTTSRESLIARIRGEYQEMPGLRLTSAQACRLWQVDAPTCQTLLEQLVSDGFLCKTENGAYIALSAAPGRQTKVQLRQRDQRRSA